MVFPNISASDAKFENPLDDPESILLRGSQLKNELIWPRRLGCRGGAIDLAAAHLVIRALLYMVPKIYLLAPPVAIIRAQLPSVGPYLKPTRTKEFCIYLVLQSSEKKITVKNQNSRWNLKIR